MDKSERASQRSESANRSEETGDFRGPDGDGGPEAGQQEGPSDAKPRRAGNAKTLAEVLKRRKMATSSLGGGGSR